MTARIVKWNPKKHAEMCIGCESPFKRGDRVIDVGACTLHYRRDCAEKYIADSKELGIEPGIVINRRQPLARVFNKEE